MGDFFLKKKFKISGKIFETLEKNSQMSFMLKKKKKKKTQIYKFFIIGLEIEM